VSTQVPDGGGPKITAEDDYPRYRWVIIAQLMMQQEVGVMMFSSLGVLLPRDIAEAMDVQEGSEVRLTLVGRQVVVEPADDTLDDGAFRRALATVLRRHRATFELLAAYDRGDWSPPRE